MLEIFVGGDIDKALARLSRNYQKDLNKDIKRHSFYESRTQRKRRKMKMSLRRLRKLESRSISRTTEARRRFSHDKRQARMDYERPKSVQAQ